MAMKIRKDDEVVVLSGDDKGVRAKVIVAIPSQNKVIVEGVNRVYKHLKPSPRNREGGRISKEMPISVSNVALFCPSCNSATRVGFAFDEEGQKIRVCRKCGANQGRVGAPKPNRVKAASSKDD